MIRAVRVYLATQADAATRSIMLTEEEIDDARVFEAILYIVSKTTTLAQYEHLFNGAIMVVIKIMTLRELRADCSARASAHSLRSTNSPP